MSIKAMSPQQLEEVLATHSTETPPEREFELWQRVGQYKIVGFYFVRTAIAWEERVDPGWCYVVEHQTELREQRFLHASELKKLIEEGDRCLVES